MLGQVNEAFGAQVWQQSMLFLTHAHACRANMGAQYDQYTRQRRSILLQMVRQAASNNMVRGGQGEGGAQMGSGTSRGTGQGTGYGATSAYGVRRVTCVESVHEPLPAKWFGVHL